MHSLSVLLDSRFASRASRFGIALFVATASVFAVFIYSDFTAQGWHTDIVTMASIGAAFTSVFSDTFVGSLVYAVFMTYEQVTLIGSYGTSAVFVHLTHISLFTLLNIIWAYIALASFKKMLWSCGYDLKTSSPVNTALGVLSTAGLSLSFALFVASALLIASSNGTLPQEGVTFRNNSPRRFVVAFSLDHFVPVFIFGPLFMCQREAALLHPIARSVSWIVVVPLVATLYVVALALLGTNAPTMHIMQLGPLASVAIPFLLGWAGCAFI